MASTNFSSGTVVTSTWLNEVDAKTHDGRIVSVFEYIPSTEWAAIQAGTSTYDCTDDLETAFAAENHLMFPAGLYNVDTAGYPTKRAVLYKSGANGVTLMGYGATIKFKATSTGPVGLNIVELSNCDNVYIAGFIFDGNSANQSYGYHSIAFFGGENLTVRDVQCLNMYYDGIYMRASTPATFSTYPTNVLLDNIYTDNCGRNGVSVIGVNILRIQNSTFVNTVGDPGAGIDIEPNASDVFGCRDVDISNVVVRDNAGRGIMVTGNAAVSTDTPYCLNCRLTNITASGNAAAQDSGRGGCDIGVYHCPDFGLYGFSNPGQDIDPMDAGLIYIHNTVISAVLESLVFRDVQTPTTTKALVYIDSSNNPSRVINDVHAYNCTATIVNGGKYSDINTLHAETCTGEYGVLLGNGRGSLRDATLIGCSLVQAYNASNTGIYTIDGLTVLNPTARALRLYVANSVIRNVFVRHTGTAATQAVWMESLTNTRCQGFDISDNGGYWATISNAYLVSQASLSGNRFYAMYPSPLAGSTTWDPASISDGAAASTTVSVLRADVGDPCVVKNSVSLAGLIQFASITSANTATVTLFNKTGGAVDLASHTITVEAIKNG